MRHRCVSCLFDERYNASYLQSYFAHSDFNIQGVRYRAAGILYYDANGIYLIKENFLRNPTFNPSIREFKREFSKRTDSQREFSSELSGENGENGENRENRENPEGNQVTSFQETSRDIYGDPGGKIEPSDNFSPINTALRELQEETDLSNKILQKSLHISAILHLDFESTKHFDGYNYLLFIVEAPCDMTNHRLIHISYADLKTKRFTRRFFQFYLFLRKHWSIFRADETAKPIDCS